MNANSITLTLLDGRSATRLGPLASLVAQDASGQFGILPGHIALVTVLEPGIFRFRMGGATAWSYGACAGGLLYCQDHSEGTQVQIVSRRFLLGEVPEELQDLLEGMLASEHSLRMSTRDSLAQLEQAFYKRVQALGQQAP